MSGHLKSYTTPKSWTILRKNTTFITRPLPGAHSTELSIPINLLLKQIGVVKTTKEAQHAINDKAVNINGKPVNDYHKSAGFMDAIHIKPKTALRCTLDEKGRLKFIEIPSAELTKKISKIIGKTPVTGGKIQLNLSDGRNMLLEKNNYNVGDSLLIEIPKQKILDHFALTKGNTVFLIGGKHTGTIGKVDDIKEDTIWLTSGKDKIKTLKKFAFTVGKDKPAVNI